MKTISLSIAIVCLFACTCFSPSLEAKSVPSGGWAVWAYKSNPKPPYHPKGWHPCYILYVASEYPNSRMTTRNGYVRVRYANTQRDADQFISYFSMHHDDKPDGVVKFHSCKKAKFCTKYANTAVHQFSQYKARRCGGPNDRWQPHFKNHYKWCLHESKSDVNRETRDRRDTLKECR